MQNSFSQRRRRGKEREKKKYCFDKICVHFCFRCAWVWDLVTGNVQHKLVHGKAPLVVPTLSVHPSATQLLTAAAGFVKLWGDKLEESEEEEVVLE